MKDLFRLAAEVQQFVQGHQWSFCFIGGLALQRWGENRLTNDIDLSILTEFGNEESFIDQLLSEYPGRRNDAREFALEYRAS